MTRWTQSLWLVCMAVLVAGRARAQDVPPEVLVEPRQADSNEESVNASIDLENIVTSAAKEVTTVQEAPAVVTVITAEDFRRWGYRTVLDALLDVPGFTIAVQEGATFWGTVTRGAYQSNMILHDGISLFEPFGNSVAIERQMPVESIKRVEVVTGPGGVLWGANSLVGITNIMTKDAEDVNGVEASAGYGDGRGDRSDTRGYVMFGRTFFNERLKLFLHSSYDNYVGQELYARGFVVRAPNPQPNGLSLYAPFQTSEQGRSWIASVDGKISSGPLSLYWLYTDGDLHWPATSNGSPIRQSAPIDDRFGPNPVTDPRGVGRDHAATYFNRFAALEYRDRFADGLLSLNAKGYYVQNVFKLSHWMSTPPSTTVRGGASFTGDASSEHAGTTLDASLILPFGHQLRFGGEMFREWADRVEVKFINPDPGMQGTPPGSSSTFAFLCPFNRGTMLFASGCPLPFAFASSREVAAAYLSDWWRPHSSLLLDGGVRLQAGFGQLGYDAKSVASGTAVWNFARNWHLKANFSQGFRPPVFNALNGNAGGGIVIAANKSLESESSNAAQGEINARLRQKIGPLHEASFRADYSYTILDHLITSAGHYQNAGRRGVSSAEFLGRAQFRGGHDFLLSYTFLRVADEERGYITASPSHWINLNAKLNLLRDRLHLVSALRVSGTADDPNRMPMPKWNDCLSGAPHSADNCASEARTSDLGFDRIAPWALWNVGIRWMPTTEWEIGAFAYNVLDQRWFMPDYLYDLFPQGNDQPYPGAGRSFFTNIRFRY